MLHIYNKSKCSITNNKNKIMKNENMKPKKTLVFTMRMNPDTKQKLESLARNKTFKFNNSAVITKLIEAEHFKTFKQNGK